MESKDSGTNQKESAMKRYTVYSKYGTDLKHTNSAKVAKQYWLQYNGSQIIDNVDGIQVIFTA